MTFIKVKRQQIGHHAPHFDRIRSAWDCSLEVQNSSFTLESLMKNILFVTIFPDDAKNSPMIPWALNVQRNSWDSVFVITMLQH